MKICGLHSGHDCSFAILNNGYPEIHHELERFSRVKFKIDDSIKFMMDVYPYYSNIDVFTHVIMNWKGGIQKRYPDTYQKIKSKLYGDMNEVSRKGIGHHKAHAANAFFSSNYKNALIITSDGGGDDFDGGNDNGDGARETTFAIWLGKDNKIYPIKLFQNTKFNLGIKWSNVTQKIMKLNFGQEGTVMAMSAYGDENKYIKDFRAGDRTNEFYKKEIDMDEYNKFHIAAALQKYTEEKMYETLYSYMKKYAPEVICLSGGTFLNSIIAGKFYDWYPFVKKIYIPPAPYDAGLAMGTAQYYWHHINNNYRIKWNDNFTPYLGYSYDEQIIKDSIENHKNIIESKISNDEETINLLNDQKIISIYGGKSETGRRALGNRSILADPRNANMKKFINEKVKNRQWFRPFAPSILREEVKYWFERDVDSPYMSIVLKFKKDKLDKVPAVVHKDGSARLQTVTENDNKWYYNFIKKWKEKTGIPILLNTSFNDREPIVETPNDAINCFLNTNIDYLYFYEPRILVKKI